MEIASHTLSPSANPPLHVFLARESGMEYMGVRWAGGKPRVSPPVSLEASPASFQKQEGDRVVLILPKRLVMARPLVLPSTNESELARMVDIRALKLFPLLKDERWVHFEVLEKTAEGYSSLMLYCVQKSTLQPLLAPLLEKGIVPDEMWIRPALLTRFLNAKFPSEEAFRFAYASTDGVEVAIGKKDSLLFSRFVDVDSRAFGGNLPPELRQAFENAEQKLRLKSSPDYFWVTEEASPLPPPQLPVQAIPARWTPVQVSWEDCLSAWRKHPSPPFSIPMVEEHRKIQQKKIPLLRFVFLVALMGVLLIAGLKFENASLNAQYEALTSSIQKIKGDAERILTLKEQLDFAATHYSASEKLIAALQELCHLTPNGTTLTLFQTKGTRDLLLKGVSKSGLLDMVEKLEKSPVFKNVSLKSQNKSAKDQGIEFYILCSLEEP